MLNHVQGQVWKRLWIFEARSENGCGKLHFLVWNWVWIWRCGRHTPTKNSNEYPLPGSYDNKRKKQNLQKLDQTTNKSGNMYRGLHTKCKKIRIKNQTWIQRNPMTTVTQNLVTQSHAFTQINARIGQLAMVYCAGKPMENSRVFSLFWIII